MTQPESGDPVGWDPCEEIRYRINPAGEPPGGTDAFHSLLDTVTVDPDCDQSADQPLVTCWPPGNGWR